jgi:predicted metal-dependent hydrolase
MKYLQAYPPDVQAQVQRLVDDGKLGEVLRSRYPKPHAVRTDRALYDYVMALKNEHMRSSEPLSRVMFDAKLHVISHALGTHTTISRVQGSQLKSKREIRIATLFKDVPEPFLKMIAVHELAHIKERQHDKAFYKLCTYMAPDYHQLEFDVRLYLTYTDSLSTVPRAAIASGPNGLWV